MKPNLSNVTLFATTPEPLVNLTLRSLDISRSAAYFAHTILFTEGEQIPSVEGFECIKIPPVGSAQNSGIHYYRNLPQYLRTSHVLVVDWDGWIIHPEMWSDDFLQYDFIGSRWPWKEEGRNVGNTGFCLVSKRLLEIVGRRDIDPKGTFDNDMCSIWRPELEREHGLKFAPGEVADRFAYERTNPNSQTFGFHGMFNWWRHVDDSTMVEVSRYIPQMVAKQSQFEELMNIYANLRKFKPFLAMHDARIRQEKSAA